MKNQLNLLVENPVWSTSKTYDLVDGFSYESIYGDRISILNHAGEPVDLPLDRKGKDLIIKLNDNGGAATIENFFVDVKEESTLNGIQSDEVEVSLGADDSEESEIARSPTTEIDDSFTLIRGSEVSHLNFGNPGGSSNVAIDLFGGNGFSGGNYGGNVPQANQPAIARDDAASIDENNQVAIDLLLNDTDPEGGSLTLQTVNGSNTAQVTLPSGAVVTQTGGGIVNYDPLDLFDYLSAGATEIDSFTYTISDSVGNISQATATVTINGVNDAPPSNPGSGPGIYDDTIAINEDVATPATGNVLSNDSDPDGDSLTVTAVNGVSGNVGSLTAGSFGSITINSDGTYSYAVDNTNAAVQALGVGQFATDTFTYLADDGNGGSAAASLVVTINGVNDAPPSNPGSGPGIYDDTDSIDEDDASPATGSVLANDADPDGDSLTVTAVNGVSGNVGSLTAGSYGSITINSDGTYSYAVDNTNTAVQALGVGQFATDTFTYLADDGNGGSAAASLVVTINGVNDAPPSNPGSGPGIYDDTASINEDDASPATGSVLANDADPDGDSLTVTAVNGVSGNVGSLTAGSYGSITINSDGTYSYAVDNTNTAVQALGVGQFATDTFTYLADDGNGGSAAASLVVTINGVNDAPPSNPGSGPGIYDDTASI
ncbi:MAG: Ig-like domain-containing protein, partial [Verrucomicrobiales bacterium]|nr:Ig-like domain-containing protein [Verrucomicrobiales bacterium]